MFPLGALPEEPKRRKLCTTLAISVQRLRLAHNVFMSVKAPTGVVGRPTGREAEAVGFPFPAHPEAARSSLEPLLFEGSTCVLMATACSPDGTGRAEPSRVESSRVEGEAVTAGAVRLRR